MLYQTAKGRTKNRHVQVTRYAHSVALVAKSLRQEATDRSDVALMYRTTVKGKADVGKQAFWKKALTEGLTHHRHRLVSRLICSRGNTFTQQTREHGGSQSPPTLDWCIAVKPPCRALMERVPRLDAAQQTSNSQRIIREAIPRLCAHHVWSAHFAPYS